MRARGWAALAVLWFGGVGLYWWGVRRERAEVAAARGRAETALAEAAAALAAVLPEKQPRRSADLEAAEAQAARRVDGARLWADVEALAFERATLADRARARHLVAHRLTELGFRPTLMGFGAGVNVVGERPGTDAAAGVVLVAAHYDGVEGTPGADDNATGVAAALELARLLGPLPTPAALRVALFDAEEQELAGSRAYVSDPARLEGVRAVVVLEMLGATCDRPGCQQVPEGLAAILGPRLGGLWRADAAPVGDFLAVVGTFADQQLLAAFRAAGGPGSPGDPQTPRGPGTADSPTGGPAATQAGTPADIQAGSPADSGVGNPPTTPTENANDESNHGVVGVVTKPPVLALPVPERGLDLPDTRRSDHAPFWDAGVRAVMVTDTADLRTPHYHRASDRPEHLDRRFFEGASQVAVDAVWRLLHP